VEGNRGSLTQILSKVSGDSVKEKKPTQMSALKEESETGRREPAEEIGQWQQDKDQSMISLQADESVDKRVQN
jgi:hypothetical protein